MSDSVSIRVSIRVLSAVQCATICRFSLIPANPHRKWMQCSGSPIQPVMMNSTRADQQPMLQRQASQQSLAGWDLDLVSNVAQMHQCWHVEAVRCYYNEAVVIVV